MVARNYRRRPAFKKILYEEFNGICVYCMIQCEYKDLSIDHIIPRAYQGKDKLLNLILACRKCNENRGIRSLVATMAHYDLPPEKRNYSKDHPYRKTKNFSGQIAQSSQRFNTFLNEEYKRSEA